VRLEKNQPKVFLSKSVFCPCRSALVGPNQHLAKKPPLSLKSFESDHEIMQNGIICLNLVEKM
jgi:hypothetical protein